MTFSPLTPIAYYAIQHGKEGIKPRTLHKHRGNLDDETMCGVRTYYVVSYVSDADTDCPTCYPNEE